jgi:hypothetical protein
MNNDVGGSGLPAHVVPSAYVDLLKRHDDVISAILEAVFEAVVRASSGVVRLLGGLLVDAAVAVADFMASALPGDRERRRRHRDIRRRVKVAASAGDGGELLRLYRSLDRDPEETPIRIDVLRALAATDRSAAQPVLREAIEGSDHAWLAITALDRIEKLRLVELGDLVRTAQRDPRPVVASFAASVAKRLR